MTNIRPSSELRNNYNEISKLCKESNNPVYITVNGKGDLAVMDIKKYDELIARLDTLTGILKGMKDTQEGKIYTEEEVRARFNKKG